MKKVTLEKSFQSLLDKQFNKFLSIEIEGIELNIMPLKEDIPKIEDVILDEKNDTMAIRFSSKEVEVMNKSKHSNHFVEIHVDEDGVLTEIKINTISKIKSLKSKYQSELQRAIQIKPSSMDKRKVLQDNFNKRKLNFLKEAIKQDLVPAF